MKKKILVLFNIFLSIYITICMSFFCRQYETISGINSTDMTNFEYLIRDNLFVINISVIILVCILINLIFICEYWVSVSKNEITTRRLIGYTFRELIKDVYLKFCVLIVLSYCISIVFSSIILNYWEYPIILPVIISFGFEFVILSIITLLCTSYYLYRLRRNKVKRFKLISKSLFALQLTASFTIILLSIIVFREINDEISPHRKYMNLQDSWNVSVDFKGSKETIINVEQNPEVYRGDVLEKLKNIYKTYDDNIIVFFEDTLNNHEPIRVAVLNEKGLDINGLSTSPVKNSNEQEHIPIILSSEYRDKFKVGDIINSDLNSYIVSEISSRPEFNAVSPIGHRQESRFQAIGVFTNNHLNKNLDINNYQFLNHIFFHGIDEKTIEGIRSTLSHEKLEYKYQSLREIQATNFKEKQELVLTYAIVGGVNLVFGLLGLYCSIVIDFEEKKVRFSIFKILGYTCINTIRLPLSVLLTMFVFSMFLATQIASKQLLVLPEDILNLLLIAGCTFILISWSVYRLVRNLKTTEIIGGENV